MGEYLSSSMGGCREHAACLKIAPSVVSLVHELQGDQNMVWPLAAPPGTRAEQASCCPQRDRRWGVLCRLGRIWGWLGVHHQVISVPIFSGSSSIKLSWAFHSHPYFTPSSLWHMYPSQKHLEPQISEWERDFRMSSHPVPSFYRWQIPGLERWHDL